jgi:predicted PurR-regulated permease PerM
VLILIFLGLLLAVVLRTLAGLIAHRTPLNTRGSLVVVVLLFLILVGVGGWFFIPEVASQAEQFIDRISWAMTQVERLLSRYEWGQQLIRGLVEQNNLSGTAVLNRLTSTFTLTLEGLANSLFILFIAFFVAIDPDLYRTGMINLIPPQGRNRAREVIHGLVHGLRLWLLGQFIQMVIVGTVITIGLALMNIPLSWALGLLAGLFEFIPVLGPILSAVPGILVAFTVEPIQAVYVALFYLVVQQIEGNVLTPIVQQKVVSIPPAITLTAILVMSVLFGPLGAFVATAVAIVIIILVRMIYLEDILKTEPRINHSR